ncbi:hypothetical protein J4421_01655 [Candidatus Woesearchaeota archaeon]|nr:hypothetical protein [Candidatus Woesearchaeota archaeon]
MNVFRYNSLSFSSRIALDLDCTLSDTQQFYFRECNKISPIEEKSIDELIKEYYYAENVPKLSGNKQIEEWLIWFRNSNQAHEELPLFPGAQEGVAKINSRIKIGAYLSGRLDTVYEGSKRWLQKHGFPEAPLYLRPKIISGNHWQEWKARVLSNLFPLIRGAVDDDRKLPYELQKIGYQGKIFIFGCTDHPLADGQYLPCPAWKDVALAVEKSFS